MDSKQPRIRRACLFRLLALGLLVGGLVTACSPNQKQGTFVVGVMNPTTIMEPVLAGFKSGLGELGYKEGQTITYVYDGPVKRQDLEAVAQRLLKQKVDLILAITTPAAQAAQAAGTGLPIVFAPVTDPVDAGLVTSLKRPGDNLTGVATGGSDAQRLAWLLRVVPGIKRVYLPYNPNDRSPVTALAQISAAADKLGVQLVLRQAGDADQVQAAIAAIPPDVDAIFIGPDSLVGSFYSDWIAAAIDRKLPLTGSSTSHVQAGMLLSYSYDTVAVGRQAARLADQIFEGVAAADLPVETAEFYLSINVKTASAIGLDVPDSILRQAYQVFR